MARKLQIVGKFPSGGAVDPSEVKKIVDDHLAENPPTINFTINGEGPDENNNFVIDTSPEESSNVVEF